MTNKPKLAFSDETGGPSRRKTIEGQYLVERTRAHTGGIS